MLSFIIYHLCHARAFTPALRIVFAYTCSGYVAVTALLVANSYYSCKEHHCSIRNIEWVFVGN